MGMTPGQEPLGYAAQSVAGRVRDHNEDALLCRPALGLWAVADGMGGHSCGEVASAIALETLERELAAGLPLEVAVHGANRAVLEAAAGLDDERRGMGTTLVAVRFQGSDFELAWVGDSRAYRIDAAGIHQISRDHSWVQALVDAGQMTPAEARVDARRNVITQCLGRDDQELEVGLLNGSLQPGELLLLCSDGLSGELEDGEIHAQCNKARTLDGMVDQLIVLANSHGGRDNITCIVLGLPAQEQEVPPEPPPRSFLSRLFKPRKQR